jgi:hypothetical protein
MKTNFTFLKQLVPLIFFVVASAILAEAQITQNHPTAQNETFGGCNTCSIATISNPANSMTGDTTSYTEIFTRRNGGITGQRWAEITYNITPSTDNNYVFVRLTASDNTAEPAVRIGSASGTEGGTTINLYYQGNQVTTNNINFMVFTDIHNNTWYRLSTAENFDQLRIRVTSKNYDLNYDRHIRSAKIYSIYTNQGSATLDDCGLPTMVAFEGKIDGLPLAGPVTARLGEAIDGNFESHTSGVLAGVVNIGAPSWNYTTMFNGLSGGTSTLKLTIGRGATIVNLSGIRYRLNFINNGVSTKQTDWTTLQVLGLLGINSYAPLTFYHEATVPFDEVVLEVQVPGVSITGEMIRVYDIRRTVPAPTLSGALNSSMDVVRNTPAQVLATGAATEYLWYQGVLFTDPDTKQSGYIIDEATGLLEKTIGTAIATPLRTLTEFNFGTLTQDTVLFVRSIRASCPTDTSAAHAITLRAIDAPLPVTLAEISASRDGSNALIQWATTEETDNHYFEVQRSSDLRNWEVIGTVYSQNITGTGKGLLNYQYIDTAPYSGVNYYRLNQVDLDGTFSETNIVSIFVDGQLDVESYVYPNPAQNYFHVAAAVGSQVSIYDMLGRLVASKTVLSAVKDVAFEASQLPTGNFFVHITKDGVTQKYLLRIQK